MQFLYNTYFKYFNRDFVHLRFKILFQIQTLLPHAFNNYLRLIFIMRIIIIILKEYYNDIIDSID